MMLSIAILDDNIRMLEEYEQILPAWFSKNNIKGQIVAATTDYREFLREVCRNCANVCIIDINLRSEVNGIYIAKYLRKENIRAEIIFCTGMLEFMQQAFDVNAYHFRTKPVGSNLERCLIRLNKEIEEREVNKRIIEFKTGSRVYYVPIDSITHVLRDGTKTIIHTQNKVLEVYESLDSISARMNDKKFIKCHRAVIVNKDYVEYIDKKNRTVVLTNGFSCKLGARNNTIFLSQRKEQQFL